MVKHIGNIAFAFFMLIASVYLWFVADAFPVFEKYRDVDSDFWPKILMTMIGLFSVGVIYQSIMAFKADLTNKKMQITPEKCHHPIQVDWKRFSIMALICMGYFYGLQNLGFLISTLIFLWISIPFIGLKRKFLLIVYPLAFTAALSFLFVKVLELSLPRGQWIFRDFSLLFY